jgi:DNA (cytosine-5)-methyltransferase 1
LNGLALCAGVGGLERGIESILPSARTVCFVEGETYPASVLASKMEAGSLPKAPIWSNVRTFDGNTWRGKISFLSGGFPCQPYSTAGKQLADKDPRDLWPDFARIIGEVRPHFIFLENVPNVVKWALPTVLKDLSKMGYDAAWCVVAASQVGAPHKRARWFLFAHTNDSSKHAMRFHDPQSSTQEFEEIDFTNANGERRNEVEPNLWSGEFNVEGCGDKSELADTHSQSYSKPQRTGEELRQKGSRLEGWKDQRETGHFIRSGGEKIPNSNGERSREGGILFKRTNGEFINGNGKEGRINISDSNGKGTERHRGKSQQGQILQRHINEEGFKFGELQSWWKVEPGMGRMVDGVADWVHRMRACGNGVVPQQAAYAYSILMERCGFMVSKP